MALVEDGNKLDQLIKKIYQGDFCIVTINELKNMNWRAGHHMGVTFTYVTTLIHTIKIKTNNLCVV